MTSNLQYTSLETSSQDPWDDWFNEERAPLLDSNGHHEEEDEE